MRKIIINVLFYFLSTSAFANVGTDLDDFFNKMGYASNTTNVQAFQSQASGFFGGGSIYVRNQVREYQLVTLDLPDYRAGCGGIDLYTGSLSYISGDKLVDLGKQVMTNSGAYAVDVMLATTVPALKQVRDFLQTVAQKANQMSINSCEATQNLVGGLWPKTVASQEKICNDQSRLGRSGMGHDYVAAHMDCAGASRDKIIQEAAKDPAHEKQVVLDKNLVWSMLQGQAFLAKDEQLTEMVMSLTGTLIIDKNGHVTNVPSLAGSNDLLNALIGAPLQGAQSAKIWHCNDTTKCMSVSLKTVDIPADKALSARIRKIIRSMDEKLKSDTAFDATEHSFLSMTALPVLKFLEVLNGTEYGEASVDIEEYSTLIAEDLMAHYLSELLQQVTHATYGSEINDGLLQDIRKRIDTASAKIAAIDPKVSRKLIEKLTLINNVARIEKQVAASLGNLS